MEIFVPPSFCFFSNLVVVASERLEKNEENESAFSLPEVYARFLMCKKIIHPNLCRYFEVEVIDKDSIVIISESYSWTLEKLFLTRM
jgi:hypothetical protein